MTLLQIKLFGGFTVTLEGQPVTKFRSDKVRALLAYLAVQPDRDHARTSLATLLWGDLPDSAAKTNLRIELSNLKKVLKNHPALEISRNSVRFHGTHATVDALLFAETITAFLALPAELQLPKLTSLSTALDRYQGEFLAGFQLGGTVEFDDWQLLTQEQFHEQAIQALTTLQQRYTEQGNWLELAHAARRQLALVPWQERAHRNLIQALAAQGQRAAALTQYTKCCEILQEELGVEPTLATQEIAVRLRMNDSAPRATGHALIRHNLPQQLKPLVGRESEVERVYTLVQTERLVTILGLGGVGKSRLAQAVAQRAIHDFADGVWFVPLANIEMSTSTNGRIALAIAAAIGFVITDTHSPWVELNQHLAQKKLLLVLDNWEQLVSAADEIFEELFNHTSVHVLATSRVRLMLEGEAIFGLGGLSAPDRYTLFVERARRIVASFSGTDAVAEIAQICEAVGGLPLGIELAASWVEHIPLAEIGRSLTTLAVAPTQAGKLTDRHQTLQSVFEYSWQLLSPQQQQIVARLSTFRGGFDRGAANTVANSTLSDLSILIAHSLVQRVSAGRYDLHPLVQEFAASKVTASEAATLFTEHSRYYLTKLIHTVAARYATELQIEFDNLHIAWHRAMTVVEQRALAAIVKEATVPFGAYMLQCGLVADGEALFQAAVAHYETQVEEAELLALLLDQQAIFIRSNQGPKATIQLLQRALSLTKDPHLQARVQLDLANHHAELGEWTAADLHFDQAEALAEATGELTIYITAVEARVHINAIHFRGDFAQGIARLSEMITLLDHAPTPIDNDDELRIKLYQSLSLIAVRYRNYGLAIHYAKKGVLVATAHHDRRRRCFFLLDLALAEQFAGLYTAAVAHNKEALALAEEMGDSEEVGLLNANLCLTLRQAGALTEALAHGEKAVELLYAAGQARMEGQARNRVGHTLLALEEWAAADSAYADALSVWDSLPHANRYEALAGRAVAAYHLGRTAEALRCVETVLDFVTVTGLAGIVEPILLLLHCECVLRQCNQIAQANGALRQADEWVQMVSARLQDAEICAAFIARPDNCRLQARITRHKQEKAA